MQQDQTPSSAASRIVPEIEETPCWVERQRLRRLYEAIVIHRATGSPFLLDWAENEIMHIVRES